jgi:TonB family protein
MRRLFILILLFIPLVANAQPFRVGGDVKAPVAIVYVDPIYPQEARQARVSGIVILDTVIDHNGVVKDVRVRKPLPFGLSEAAVDAVKQWSFKPGTLNGEAVDVVFELTVNFKLDNKDFDPNGPMRVSGDVHAPVVVEKVEPLYTKEARKARISGIVVIEAVIGRDGLVKIAKVVKPLPFGLDQAAVDAVKQWKFEPATLQGKPVDVFYTLAVSFSLDAPRSSITPESGTQTAVASSGSQTCAGVAAPSGASVECRSGFTPKCGCDAAAQQASCHCVAVE